MNRIILVLFAALIAEFVFVEKVIAVSLDVNNIPSTVSASPFSVTVSILGANVGKNYLRVDLFKEGTVNYFGETYNGSEWATGSIGTSYFPIDIISSNATATADVQVQVGAPSGTDYLGSGLYKLRIRRYTSASSYSAGNPYDIVINIPTPAPTETPQPTSTPTPVPTKTPTSVPTRTPTPIPTITLTPKSTQTPNFSENLEDESSSFSGQVLGATGSIFGVSSSLKPSPSPNVKNNNTVVAAILIGLGILFVVISLYFAYKTSKSSTTQNDI